MKEGWKEKRLGDIATYINGFAFKPCDWGYKGKPIIRIQNLTDVGTSFNRCSREDIPSKYNVTQGDILISWSATLGVFEWEREDSLLNQHIFKVVFDKGEINKSFFKYAVSISIGEMSKHTNGATMKHIRKGDFDNITVPVPPLSEQDRIVKKLDEAFAKIDALKQNAEKGLQAVKDLWQATLKEELKPKEGWETKSVGELTSLITKGASPKWQGFNYTDNGALFITSENVREGFLDVSVKKFLDEDFNTKQSRSVLKKHDVLVNIVGASIGRAAIFDLEVDNANINQAVALVRFKDDIFPSYACRFFNSTVAFEFYDDMKKDSARANLSLQNIADIKLAYPSKEEQLLIIEKLNQVSDYCSDLKNSYIKELAEYESLKQSILRKAFSGEL